MKRVLTTGDIARYCNVSLSTVFRWIQEGHVQAYVTPGGHHRILARDFRAFLERYGMPIDDAFFSGGEVAKRVLIIHDEPQVVGRIIQALKHNEGHFEVASTDNGFEAGMLVRAFQPRLVILGSAINGSKAAQICQRIRTNPETAQIRILMITETLEGEEITRFLAQGGDDTIAQPLDTTQLLEKVERLVIPESATRQIP